jgi:hypothetical protein
MIKTPSKNLQHGWSILCSGTSVDQDTNNLTLFNIIDQISIPEDKLVKMPGIDGKDKPAAPVGFNLVTLWRKSETKVAASAEVEVELLDPSGTMRQKGDYSVDLPEGITRLRSRMQWNGIRVTTSGTYTFKISLKEAGDDKFRKVGEIYLDIQILSAKSSEKNQKKGRP